MLAPQLPGALQDVAPRELVIQGVEAALRVALRGLVKLRLEFGRSVCGWVSRIDTHRTDLLSLHSPAAGPSLGESCVVSRLRAVLGPAPTPSRLACALTEEGLSRSGWDCPCIPRPLRRRVLDGCTSQGFTASVAFAAPVPARLPLFPLPGCLTTPQTSRDAADCRIACPPREDVVSGLRQPDFAGPPPLRYSAAGTLPRPDFHWQAQRGFSGHTQVVRTPACPLTRVAFL